MSVLKKSLMGIAAAATLAATASPADAQYRRYRHHDNTGVAIGAGILGLGIGAAIASSGNRGYYSDPYDSGYGYGSRGYSYGYSAPAYGYDRGYYGNGYSQGYYGSGYGYSSRRHCTTRREFDEYTGRWVRVRYC